MTPMYCVTAVSKLTGRRERVSIMDVFEYVNE